MSRENALRWYVFTSLTAVYFISYPLFTYLRPDTPARIIIISALLCITYSLGVSRLNACYRGKKGVRRQSAELYYLFLAASVFYALRLILPVTPLGRVSSLMDPSLITSASLLFVVVFCLAFILGTLITTLREGKGHNV